MSLHDHIPAALRGERAAQRALFAALAPQAFRVAMRYVRERADAEDIVQEAMARTFHALDRFDAARGRLETWAYRIAVNESLRYLKRRRGALLFVEHDGELPAHIDREPLATDHLAAADLRRLILRLPDGYRAVFNLAEVEGYAHDEIAATLDISPATSRSQLARAKRLLRKWIAPPQGSTDTPPSTLAQIAAL